MQRYDQDRSTKTAAVNDEEEKYNASAHEVNDESLDPDDLAGRPFEVRLPLARHDLLPGFVESQNLLGLQVGVPLLSFCHCRHDSFLF